MSYINAFVAFGSSQQTYPVNCLRADVKVGDQVVVIGPQNKARIGRVDRMEFHNWNCQWTIRCLASEAERTGSKLSVDQGVPSKFGPVEIYDVPRHLARSGWIRRNLASGQFKVGYSFANQSHLCHILIRTNGFDVAFAEGTISEVELSKPLSISDGSVRVRHSLNESGINLIDYMIVFSDAFRTNTADIERFLVRVGSSSKKKPHLPRSDTSMQDIYDAISGGSGGPAYLGDGVYLTQGGWFSD